MASKESSAKPWLHLAAASALLGACVLASLAAGLRYFSGQGAGLPPPLRSVARSIAVQLVDGRSGGPEALVQLALAVQDAQGVRLKCLNQSDEIYRGEYPDLNFRSCSTNVSGVMHDDVVIVPEVMQCEAVGKVLPHIWLLGAWNFGPDKCARLAHNHWLARKVGISTKLVLAPYVSPSIVRHAVAKAGLLRSGSFSNLSRLAGGKGPILLVDNEAENGEGGERLSAILAELRRRGTKVVVVSGFTREQVLRLQLVARAVVGFCMRGTERMPIESVLHGAVLFTNSCLSGSDRDDYPISERHRAVSVEGIQRAIHNYEEEVMDPGQVRLRRKYGFELSRKSLARDVERWAASLPPPPLRGTVGESGPGTARPHEHEHATGERCPWEL